MFTGIIESLGEIVRTEKLGTNLNFTIKSPISKELKVDQSVAHNGVCLTVTDCNEESHIVTAVEETMAKTSLGSWDVNQVVNLERCMKLDHRLDGHMVYGHVDTVGECIEISKNDGSTNFTFSFPEKFSHLIVEKGSVSINGTSLTVFDVQKTSFKVTIIPFTFDHTSFNTLLENDAVNLEFDIIAKYVERLMNKG